MQVLAVVIVIFQPPDQLIATRSFGQRTYERQMLSRFCVCVNGVVSGLQLVLFSTNVDRFEISATPSDDTSEFQELASLLEAAWEPIETERTREESEYLQEKRKKKEIMARGIDEIIGDGGLTV